MYLLKSNKQKNCIKNYFFVGVLKVNDENSRIRIHLSETWIHGSGSGSGSIPKCHGSARLLINGEKAYLLPLEVAVPDQVHEPALQRNRLLHSVRELNGVLTLSEWRTLAASIGLQIRLWILLFSSVAFEMSTKNKLFYKFFKLFTNCRNRTFSTVFKDNRSLRRHSTAEIKVKFYLAVDALTRSRSRVRIRILEAQKQLIIWIPIRNTGAKVLQCYSSPRAVG